MSPSALPCKICAAAAFPFAAVDANRSCAAKRGADGPPAGLSIQYWRCPVCGFLFTVAFDQWSTAEWGERIYNAGYAAADPDFAEVRPMANARLLAGVLAPLQGAPTLLDFGGGHGRLAQLLREARIAAVSYDPLEEGSRPSGRFDVVTAFEVVEHAPHPRETMADIAALLAPEGLLVFSTLLQPDAIERLRGSWWYMGPRNGHVSLHTGESLGLLCRQAGLTFRPLGPNLHLAYRTVSPLVAAVAARLKP